jgi:hypothetical protein
VAHRHDRRLAAAGTSRAAASSSASQTSSAATATLAIHLCLESFDLRSESPVAALQSLRVVGQVADPMGTLDQPIDLG